MSLRFDTQFHADKLAATARVAPSATVCGDVWLGTNSSVWFHAVVRGDTETIRIGADTNIQDLCMVHADPGFPCRIGDRVTVGHSAIVHGAEIEDDVMIGMRAVILNGARVGRGSIIGAGTVVTEGTVIEPNSLVFGVPGKRIRETTGQQRARLRQAAEHYVAAARAFFSDLPPAGENPD